MADDDIEVLDVFVMRVVGVELVRDETVGEEVEAVDHVAKGLDDAAPEELGADDEAMDVDELEEAEG